MLQRSRPIRSSRSGASGFVLVIALILMAVMGILSTAGIRLALQGDTVSLGLRSVNLTTQAAEIGLRWCELQARMSDRQNTGSQVIIKESGAGGSPTLWQSVTTFEANAVSVPNTVMTAAGLTNFPTAPRCIVETETLNMPLISESAVAATITPRSYVSTVRAFSPDYNRQGSDRIGSEVWLQSRLILSYSK